MTRDVLRERDAGTRTDGPISGFRAGTYLPELESLRGLAILLVVLFHLVPMALPVVGGRRPSVPVALIQEGHTGVTLFFVLSAFLLSLPFLAKTRRFDRADLLEFCRRRVLRIVPLYWAVIVVGGILAASTWADLLRVLPFLVFVHGVWPVEHIATFTGVTWSLATEVQFYALLPLLPWALSSPARRRVGWFLLTGVIALYLACICRLIVTPFMHPAGWMIGSTIVGRGPVFLLGILGAAIYLRFGDRIRTWKPIVLGGDVALVLCFVSLELLLRWLSRTGYLTGEFPPYLAWHVAEGALWTMILLLLLTAPLVSRRLLVNPFLKWLGILSYSIYLLHWPILSWSRSFSKGILPYGAVGPAAIAWWAATFCCIVIVAGLSYRLIERPFLRRKAATVRPMYSEAPPSSLTPDLSDPERARGSLVASGPLGAA